MSNLLARFVYGIGRAVRETGQALDRQGCRIQGNMAFKEQLSRHRRLMPLGGVRPDVGQDTFVAPNATIIGKVKLGDYTNVWYGAVIRGDVNSVEIGSNVNIGEDTVVHVAGETRTEPARPTIVEDNAIIEHGVVLHACTIESGAWVQSGAVVLDGSVVESGAIVGPGAVVTGKRVPSGEFWFGLPASKQRALTEQDRAAFEARQTELHRLGQVHDGEHAKDARQLQTDREQWRPPAWGSKAPTNY